MKATTLLLACLLVFGAVSQFCPNNVRMTCPIQFSGITGPICHISEAFCDGIMCKIHACTYANPIAIGATATLSATVPGLIQRVDIIQSSNCTNPEINKGGA